MKGFEKTLRHVGYFSSVFYPSDNAAKAYADGKKISSFKHEDLTSDNVENMDISDMTFSVIHSNLRS